MRARLLAALVVGVLVFSIFGLVRTSSVDPVNSVVLVYNEDGHGSGAIIGPDCVLTAKHVAVQPDLKVRTNDGDEYQVVRVELDPDSDLGLLYIDGRFDEPVLPFDLTPLRVGDEIRIVGYPADFPISTFPGHVVVVDYESEIAGRRNVNLDVLDAHVFAGCSGGPVLDEGGHIRAVWVAYNATRFIVSYAVPVEELNVERTGPEDQ